MTSVVERPLVELPPLPEDAHRTEQCIWDGVLALLSVDRVCGCHLPGEPIVAGRDFMARWTGISPELARDGIERLRTRGFLTLTDQVPLSRSNFKANRYIVRGER